MTLPDFVYQAINAKAPRIDEDSFRQAMDDIKNATEEDDVYPVAAVAAAIHEFSKMINDHIIELYIHMLEKERDEQEDK